MRTRVVLKRSLRGSQIVVALLFALRRASCIEKRPFSADEIRQIALAALCSTDHVVRAPVYSPGDVL